MSSISDDPLADIRRRREAQKEARSRRRSIGGRVIDSVKKGLNKILNTEDDIEKMSPIVSYVYQIEPVVRRPVWRYDVLIDVASRSWLMRQVLRAIAQEVLGQKWDLKPRFETKCLDCGHEHEEKVDECEKCGSDQLREPSEEQFNVADGLLKHPNPDYNFDSLLRSLIFYKETVDDWYLSIAYKREFVEGEWSRTPKEIYIEDSRFLFPIADDRGHLGNDEWFCPMCYSSQEENHVVFSEAQIAQNIEPVCDKCGGALLRTCYVIELGGKKLQRFGRDEIVHGASNRLLPALFGNPPMISIYKILLTVENMDDYNWEIYRGGVLGGVLVFEGMDQTEVTDKKGEVEKELQRLNRSDVTTGQLTRSKKVRTLWLGIKEGDKVEFIPAMDNPKEMQSLEYWKSYREVVGAVYGVTPVFVSVIESGKSGNNPRMQIDVQNRKTRDVQGAIEDVFNDQLLPVFGVYEWMFRFNVIEQQDELREAQIEEAKAAYARMYVEMGFDVSRDEEGNIVITGEAVNPYEMGISPQYGGFGEEGAPGAMPRTPRISEESGGWTGDLKSVLTVADQIGLTPEEVEKAREEGTEHARLPPGSEEAMLGMEAELQETVKWARRNRSKKTTKANAYRKGSQIIDDYYQKMLVITQNYVSMKAGETVSSLPPEVLAPLNRLKAERKRDYRRILADELSRK